jgi:hypothetical protein
MATRTGNSVWWCAVTSGWLAAVLLVAGAGSAAAQAEQSTRAYRGLFGGPPPDAKTRQVFDLNVSTFAAYDDNVLAEQGGLVTDPVSGRSGVFSGVDAGASFSRIGQVVDFMASAGGSMRYYPQVKNVTALGEQGTVGLSAHSRRTRVRFNETVGYTPYYMLAPFAAPAPLPGDVAPLATDASVYQRTAVSYGTDASLEHSISRRSDMRLTYNFASASYGGESLQTRNEYYGGQYRYHVTSGAGFHLGYGYQRATFGTLAAPIGVHNLDLGIDYNKQLSRTRRTTFTFGVGTAIFDQYGTRLYRAQGDASLDHEIGRTWSARVNYHRGVGVISGLGAPFFADAATASVQGSITRRVEWRTTASYTNGDLGITGPTNTFDSYTGSSRLRYALSRTLAVYTEYVVYRYQFANLASLPVGFPPTINRQGIRAGLTLWLPLYH